jgi:hypothetical protein
LEANHRQHGPAEIATSSVRPGAAVSLRCDEHVKIYGSLHARIPMVTPDDQRAIQEENAKDDERFWDVMRDMNASMVEGQKALIAAAKAKITEFEPSVAESTARHEAAKDRLEKIRRGESVAGGLGKPLDYRQFVAILKEAGWTPSNMRHAELLATLSDAEFEAAAAALSGGWWGEPRGSVRNLVCGAG